MKFIHLLIFAFCVFCHALPVCAQPPAIGASRQVKVVMPDGFTQFYLGMPTRQFLKVQSTLNYGPLQTTDSGPGEAIDPTIPDLLVVQTLKANPQYDQALYFFDKGMLSSMIWTDAPPAPEYNSRKTAFLKELIARYGAPVALRVVRTRPLVLSSALFWKNGQVIIAASFTPGSVKNNTVKGGLDLKIATGPMANPGALYELPVVTRKEAERLLIPVRESIKRLLPGKSPDIRIELNQAARKSR